MRKGIIAWRRISFQGTMPGSGRKGIGPGQHGWIMSETG